MPSSHLTFNKHYEVIMASKEPWKMLKYKDE